MVIRLRTAFFIGLGILIIWFLYLERAILTPFILAAIFAYIFNPVVNFFSHKIRLPRTMAIFIIYLAIISAIVFLSIILSKGVVSESEELKEYLDQLLLAMQTQINTLPDWLRPSVADFISSLQKSKFLSPNSLFVIFPKAISRIISFFIFLFSAFYFLKEGRNFVDKFLLFVPKDYRLDIEITLRKINTTFGAYLRGQLFLVFVVSTILYICLSVIGVRFALILAIFSGFAEIVPIIGPITAGAIASLIVFITASNNFSLTPVSAAIIVAVTYFIVRQIQDYLINPVILGKITHLHPLIVLFAVLAGGHLWGLMGLILAVPIAATIRILLEFLMDKINESYVLKQSHKKA